MEFKTIITTTIDALYVNRKSLFRALLIPLIIALLLSLPNYVLLSSHNPFDIGIDLIIWTNILGSMVQIYVAIITHRIMILGPDSVPRYGISMWSIRETEFVLYSIALALLLLPFMALSNIPVFGTVLTYGFYFWVGSRFSLILPAAAIDQSISFGQSWRLTEKHQLLMIFVVLVPLVFVIPNYFLASVPYVSLFSMVLQTITVVLTVAFLSAAYLTIVDVDSATCK